MIRSKRFAFNVATFAVFGGVACLVLAVALPFPFFRPDPELLLRIFDATRLERETAVVEVGIRFSPWFLATAILGIGAYLAVEKNVD